jgi:ABC-2 type transport system permease protein
MGQYIVAGPVCRCPVPAGDHAAEEEGSLMSQLRLWAAIRKEMLQFSRDWMLLALIGFIYTADVVMCTYALSFEVKHLKLAVYDQDQTQLSRSLIEKFTATDYFGKLYPVAQRKEIDRLLDRSTVDMALVIPPGFAQDAARGSKADVQILLSGVNSNTANAARGYANIIMEGFSRKLMQQSLASKGLSMTYPDIIPNIRIWYNPELRFRYFMVISMIVVAGLMVGVITTCASLVREKETGTIEQLMVTPLSQGEVVFAKSVPTFVTGMIMLIPSLIVAYGFGVPMEGSLTLFFIASAIFLAAAIAIGFFISTFAQNLQQALLISFFVLFPLMFLSGTIVPVESMPVAMQYISLLSPVRYYIEIALGVLLKGVGWGLLWPKLLILLAYASTLIYWSLKRLKRQLYE